MRLLHYRYNPLSFAPQSYLQTIGDKPIGLWVSVEGEDDWPHWCKDNNFRVGALRYKYLVTPKTKKILHLATDAQILEFQDKYHGSPNWWPQEFKDRPYGINWPVVSSEYDGIIIAPYSWRLRLRSHWYYGWDCASGCLWRGFDEHSFLRLRRRSRTLKMPTLAR